MRKYMLSEGGRLAREAVPTSALRDLLDAGFMEGATVTIKDKDARVFVWTVVDVLTPEEKLAKIEAIISKPATIYTANEIREVLDAP